VQLDLSSSSQCTGTLQSRQVADTSPVYNSIYVAYELLIIEAFTQRPLIIFSGAPTAVELIFFLFLFVSDLHKV